MQLNMQRAHLGASRATALQHRAALPHPVLPSTSSLGLQQRRHLIQTVSHAGSAAAGLPADDGNSSSSGAQQGAAGSSDQKPKRGFWGSIKYFFVGEVSLDSHSGTKHPMGRYCIASNQADACMRALLRLQCAGCAACPSTACVQTPRVIAAAPNATNHTISVLFYFFANS
jgi:hypothetical protein